MGGAGAKRGWVSKFHAGKFLQGYSHSFCCFKIFNKTFIEINFLTLCCNNSNNTLAGGMVCSQLSSANLEKPNLINMLFHSFTELQVKQRKQV